jgi:hypothetical protein
MAPTDYLSCNLTPKVDEFHLKSKKMTLAIAPRLIVGGYQGVARNRSPAGSNPGGHSHLGDNQCEGRFAAMLVSLAGSHLGEYL